MSCYARSQSPVACTPLIRFSPYQTVLQIASTLLTTDASHRGASPLSNTINLHNIYVQTTHGRVRPRFFRSTPYLILPPYHYLARVAPPPPACPLLLSNHFARSVFSADPRPARSGRTHQTEGQQQAGGRRGGQHRGKRWSSRGRRWRFRPLRDDDRPFFEEVSPGQASARSRLVVSRRGRRRRRECCGRRGGTHC